MPAGCVAAFQGMPARLLQTHQGSWAGVCPSFQAQLKTSPVILFYTQREASGEVNSMVVVVVFGGWVGDQFQDVPRQYSRGF